MPAHWAGSKHRPEGSEAYMRKIATQDGHKLPQMTTSGATSLLSLSLGVCPVLPLHLLALHLIEHHKPAHSQGREHGDSSQPSFHETPSAVAPKTKETAQLAVSS